MFSLLPHQRWITEGRRMEMATEDSKRGRQSTRVQVSCCPLTGLQKCWGLSSTLHQREDSIWHLMSLQKCIYRSIANSGNSNDFNLFIYFNSTSLPLLFQTLSGNLSCFTWFVVKGIFLVVLPVRKKGEEHGFCEQWNICRKAERQEVIVFLLMLDWNKTYRKRKNHVKLRGLWKNCSEHL